MIINKNDMTKLYTSALLSIFDDIKLERRDINNPYSVPIVFGSKSRLYKTLHRKESTNTDIIYQLSVPAMSLEINGIERNLQRQTNRLLKNKVLEIDDQNVRVSWNDTAVRINFTLTLISKNITEQMQITEHIISSFKNGLYYADVNTPLYDSLISTPIILESSDVVIENNETDFNEDRFLESTFDIAVEGIIHNNITTDSKVINSIQLNMHYESLLNEILETYNITTI